MRYPTYMHAVLRIDFTGVDPLAVLLIEAIAVDFDHRWYVFLNPTLFTPKQRDH